MDNNKEVIVSNVQAVAVYIRTAAPESVRVIETLDDTAWKSFNAETASQWANAKLPMEEVEAVSKLLDQIGKNCTVTREALGPSFKSSMKVTDKPKQVLCAYLVARATEELDEPVAIWKEWIIEERDVTTINKRNSSPRASTSRHLRRIRDAYQSAEAYLDEQSTFDDFLELTGLGVGDVHETHFLNLHKSSLKRRGLV